MKICYDNLEGLKYNKKKGKWYGKTKSNNRLIYTYKDKCKNCGNPFLTTTDGNYCNSKCYGLHNSGENHKQHGKHHSEETKKRMSDAKKGKKFTEEHKKKLSLNHADNRGENNPNYGKHLSKEQRKRISDAKKGKYFGEKSPTWKGGYTDKGIPLYDTYTHQIDWCEKVRRNKEDPNVLEVKCVKCHKWYVPSLSNTKNRVQCLKGNDGYKGESRFYCSDECKHACPIYGKTLQTLMREDALRAGRMEWIKIDRKLQRELRKMVLERDKYTCQKCGLLDKSGKKLECNHVKPVSVDPLESADVDNCVTLCKKCHKKVHQKDGCRYHQLRQEVCIEDA